MNLNELPRHVAVIPDGNRRWAKARRLPYWMGHSQGRGRFHEVSEEAFRLGIPYFTFWAASEDNLIKRSVNETSFLIKLIKEELEGRMSKKLMENQIRLRVVGRWKELVSDANLHYLIDELQDNTKFFGERNLTILLGYSGKTEIAEAAKVVRRSGVDVEDITFDVVKSFSWTYDLPQVDLEIRTGEKKLRFFHRSAAFLPFLTTDPILHFTKILWPDFSEKEFLQAVAGYRSFERKFGA